MKNEPDAAERRHRLIGFNLVAAAVILWALCWGLAALNRARLRPTNLAPPADRPPPANVM
jgi:hypothetical protein